MRTDPLLVARARASMARRIERMTDELLSLGYDVVVTWHPHDDDDGIQPDVVMTVRVR